jgi:hypothetical protein
MAMKIIKSTNTINFIGSNEVMNISGTNATSAYTGYYYNTSTLVGYIGNGSSILSGAASSDFIFRSQGDLVYAAGGNTERMRITSAGVTTFSFSSSTITLVSAGTDASMIKAGSGDELYIGGNNTWQMRYSGGNILMDNGGSVGIGTSSPAKPLSVWSSGGIGVYSNNTYSPSISIDFNSGTNIGHLLADQNAYYIRTLTSYPIYVMANQNNGVYLSVGSTSWTANSDKRLKNINSNIESAIDKLLTLRAVNFSWKSDDTNKENIGLIAQDVEQVFPQIIDKIKMPSKVGEKQTDETEYLGVRYTELIPVLVKAIQELKAENDTLKDTLQRNNII